MTTWLIMSYPSMWIIGTVKALTAEHALRVAVEKNMLVEGTWKSFEVRDGFRIIILKG